MRLEKIINIAYSFGAAVVVFGAWAKLEHKEYGSIALTVGLLTETTIFFIYGLMEWLGKPAPGIAEDGSIETRLAERRAAEEAPVEKNPTSAGGFASPGEVGELTATMKQTNQILHKVFRTE
ncbi:MAG TPA: hypothetical protein VL832_17385 [Puia sp.]|nr:hypothetical protein [Puia sp.]